MKTTWSALLGLLLLAAPAALQAQFNYTSNNDVITITGYTGTDDVVNIPDTIDGLPVASIGAEAFESNGLSSVTIPATVTNIGDAAFYACSNLAALVIPGSVTTVGQQAFRACTSLATVTIPVSVTNIGAFTFFSCTNLATATISSGVTNMGNQFSGCPNLHSIVIDSGVTSVPFGQFAGLASLTSISIPNTVTNIAPQAFQAAGLTTVTIPGSVGAIGDYAFYQCSNLVSVTIENGVTTVGPDAFYDCANLSSLTLAGSVSSIGSLAFADTRLIDVAIPGGVTNVGDYAFYNCTSLASVTLPGCVTNLGNQFLGCANLQSVAIDPGVTSVGANEFAGLVRLTSVTIPGSVTSIGNYAFYACSNLANVTIEDGVTSIGLDAFYHCTSLAGLTLPDSVASIGSQAFLGAGLVSVTIPGSVASVGDFAFYACSNLTLVTLDPGVASVGLEAFGICSNLASVTIPASVTNCSNYAFLYCANLTNATIPACITNLSYQFFGCQHLHSVVIDDGVTSVGLNEFYGLLNLSSVVIPNSVTNIGQQAFLQTGLTSVTIPGSVANIGTNAFFQCTNLTQVTIGNGVRTISGYAFYECSNLTRVNIAGSVTNIGDFAFLYCGSLTTALFQGKAPAYNVHAPGFYWDTNAIVYYYSGSSGWSSPFAWAKTSAVLAPTVTTQPKSVSGLVGTNLSLSVIAGGTKPLHYQWQLNGINIPGATTNTLAILNLQVPNGGNYQVIVTNNYLESVTSVVATVTVLLPPSIATPPQSLTAPAGTNAVLSALVTGTEPLRYQWRFNGTNLPAATNATLLFSALQWTNSGLYQVVIANNYGKATSDVATVTVLAPPSITRQPPSLSVTLTSSPVLSVGVNGTPPLIFQWQFGGNNLPGATNAVLLIPNFQPTNAGGYQVVIANGYGVVTSAVASVVVVAAPAIVAPPASQSVLLGSNVTLRVTASGAAPLVYQWLLNGKKLANGGQVSGASAATLMLTKVTAANAGNYQVAVSNSLGSVTSAVAAVTVLIPPSITTQPVSQAVPLGGIAVFTVKAAGTPLTYRWLFNGAPLSDGVNISGSVSNRLTLNLVSSNNVGNYAVVISNPATAVTSKGVQLTLGRETTKPSVAIVSPKLNSRTNAPVLSGTASDPVRVFSVRYWVTNLNNGVTTINNGLAALAAGTGSVSNWTMQTALLPGTNILAVQSVNYAGLASPVASVTFFYQVRLPFQWVISPAVGLGAANQVTGVASVGGESKMTNGTVIYQLYVGEGYVLGAWPANNWWLTNWMVNGSVVGTNKNLVFTMESNLVVTANFATNLFAGAAARYDGIFYLSDAQGVTEATAGLIGNLQLKTNGVYSSTLYLAGSSYSLNGAFDRSGRSTVTIQRASPAGGPLTVQLNFLFQANPRQITGFVRGSNLGGWISTNLFLYAAATNAGNYPTYTVLLPRNQNVPDSPPSFGYLLITNTGSTINLGGALSDGTPILASAPLNEQNQFPVYANLYKNQNPGLLLGRLSLAASIFGPVPAGSLVWIKPSQATGPYTNGFATGISAQGSPWTNSPSALAGLFPDGAQLTFASGGLASNLISVVELTSSNTVERVSGSTNFIGGVLNPANGQLTLNFYPTNGKKITAYGTILQNNNQFGGFFLGATTASAVTLTPLPPGP